MDGQTTVKYLQNYIRAKDHHPDLKKDYFLKLSEEVGELAKAMCKDLRPAGPAHIKETIDEELWDVVYYALAIANCYDIDLEQVIAEKERLNQEKYHTEFPFEMGR